MSMPPVPVPPARMPMARGGRPLKRWVWVGAFGPELMLCAGCAYVGPVPQSWWAVWDGSSLSERTVRRALDVRPTSVRIPGVMEAVGG